MVLTILKDLLTNIIYPIKNNVIIIKTHNVRYAKMKIDSYYKDSPEEPNLRSQSNYYSFVYWYQPNKDVKSFE